MKYIYYTNWIIISGYIIVATHQLATLNSSGMDAAGKGMAGGFSVILIVAGIILALLNLIRIQWVRILTFILCLLPFLYLNA